MVRGKIQVKKIENEASRQVTFSKRRNGVMKKAYELSVLCEAEIALIIFSQTGKRYQFASSNMEQILGRYKEYTKDIVQINHAGPDDEQFMQQKKCEIVEATKKIQLLENAQRKLLGQDLASCTLEELQQVESQVEQSLSSIRDCKANLFKEQIKELQAKERKLLEENSILHGQAGKKTMMQPSFDHLRIGSCSQDSPISDVDTELAIRQPEIRFL